TRRAGEFAASAKNCSLLSTAHVVELRAFRVHGMAATHTPTQTDVGLAPRISGSFPLTWFVSITSKGDIRLMVEERTYIVLTDCSPKCARLDLLAKRENAEIRSSSHC